MTPMDVVVGVGDLQDTDVWKTANRALGHSGPVAEAFLNRNELELVVDELLTLAQGLRPLLLIGRVGAPDGTLVAFFEPEAVRLIVVVATHHADSLDRLDA